MNEDTKTLSKRDVVEAVSGSLASFAVNAAMSVLLPPGAGLLAKIGYHVGSCVIANAAGRAVARETSKTVEEFGVKLD